VRDDSAAGSDEGGGRVDGEGGRGGGHLLPSSFLRAGAMTGTLTKNGGLKPFYAV